MCIGLSYTLTILPFPLSVSVLYAKSYWLFSQFLSYASRHISLLLETSRSFSWSCLLSILFLFLLLHHSRVATFRSEVRNIVANFMLLSQTLFWWKRQMSLQDVRQQNKNRDAWMSKMRQKFKGKEERKKRRKDEKTERREGRKVILL